MIMFLVKTIFLVSNFEQIIITIIFLKNCINTIFENLLQVMTLNSYSKFFAHI